MFDVFNIAGPVYHNGKHIGDIVPVKPNPALDSVEQCLGWSISNKPTTNSDHALYNISLAKYYKNRDLERRSTSY